MLALCLITPNYPTLYEIRQAESKGIPLNELFLRTRKAHGRRGLMAVGYKEIK